MGSYRYKELLNLQVQARRNGRDPSGIEGLETGAGSRTADQASATGTRDTSAGAVSTDTDPSALPENAGTQRAGVNVGGVRNTRNQFGRNSSGFDVDVFTRNETNDYTTLDSTRRDVYLTGSYGLSSLYPVILMTAPRTSKVIDVNTGLTTTPFIIDLNNTIKKSIESNVINALAEFGPTLRLSTDQYTLNVFKAKQYADLCLQASLAKDRLIALTNIMNTSADNIANQTQNFVINGREYQFLKGLPDVITFIKSIQEEYDIEDFTEGPPDAINMRAVAQIFKILYNQFLLGSLALSNPRRSNQSYGTDHLWGSVDTNINDLVTGLQIIETTADQISVSPYKNSDRLADLVRIVQRDLVMQAAKSQIAQILSRPADTTVQEDLASLIGTYKDDVVYATTAYQTYRQTIFRSGYLNAADFTGDATQSVEAHPIFVGTSESENFNILDSVDYLLYDELASESSGVTLDNLVNFSNKYSMLTSKLKLVYQKIFRDDETRLKCLSIISSNFVSFFKSSISKEEFSSLASGARMGILMAAAVNDNISKKLFQYICSSNDKIRRANDLLVACENIKSVSGNDNFKFVATINVDGGEGWLDIENDYLTRASDRGTSFGMFHAIADEVERALSNGTLNNTRTDKSLNITRNARAYLFYQLFLDILRKFDFTVEFDKDEARRPDVESDEGIIVPQIRVSYKPGQAFAVSFALENYDKTTSEFENELQTIADVLKRNDARLIHSSYLDSIVTKINDQEQNCLDLINLLSNHAAQIAREVGTLTASITQIKNIITNEGITSKESILNAIQAEQAFLKKNITDRYTQTLLNVPYLPSAIDYNVNQALNVKTVVATLPVLNDPTSNRFTKTFMVAVGLPTGLMENLRYQNKLSTGEHLYTIDLIFKNLQVTQVEEDRGQTPIILSYTFSSRVFVDEGYRQEGAPDTTASRATNYNQIYKLTKFKYIDDSGNYKKASTDELAFLLGSSKIVENHFLSHYSKLFLKTTVGITFDEEAFDLVPQVRRYPDAAQDGNFTTIVDNITARYPDTAEGRLNRERAIRDLSRSISLAPDQHKISMMTSKIFERIHVIPVDISSMSSLNEKDQFIDVVARIRLEDSQPSMSRNQSPTRQSYTQAVTDVAEYFRNTDVRSQGVDAVGLDNFVETSRRFSGMLGGNRR